MGAQGTTTIDFGAFPGASDASVAVVGQAGIVAGSLVEAWIRPVDTADHTVDEHIVESLRIIAHTIVAGTGFSITGLNTNQITEPLANTAQGRFHVVASSPVGGWIPSVGGTGTRIYGVWTVAWAWN